MYEFADVFVEKPGLCNEGVHEIHVTPDFKSQRIHSKRVRMPFGLKCASDSFIRALRPVWARGRCRISPPRFLAECCKRQLNQGSFVLLYFRLFTFSDLY